MSANDKLNHYNVMLMFDKKIVTLKDGIISDEVYNELISCCTQQQLNIEKCIEKGWGIPILSVPNPKAFLVTAKMEREKNESSKALKKGYRKVAICAGALLLIPLICFVMFISEKKKIPLDSSEMINEDYSIILGKLEKAGFDNIEIMEDTTGWKKSGTVLTVTIDGTDTFVKGQYKNKDVKICITYSSKDRIAVKELLKDWDSHTFKELQETLFNNGFRNIKLNLEVLMTPDENKNGKVASVILDNRNYIDEECYLPSDALIEISYYRNKISVGYGNNDMLGKNREEVVSFFEGRGFTNIETKEITSGWGQGDTVSEISIDGRKEFSPDEYFSPEVNVIICYYCNDRIDISDILGGWEKKRIDEVEQALLLRGSSDIRWKRIATTNGTRNKLITDVMIGISEETRSKYVKEACYVSTGETIWFEYYAWNITIDEKPSAFTDEKYEEVLRRIKQKGFSNIALKRTNNVPWFKKAGNVKLVRINGNEKFDETDVFEFDVPIEIVVYTESNGYEEITLIEE